MKIGYITNIPLHESSGGMSGINAATYHELEREFNVEYIYIPKPKTDYLSKIWSKLRRILSLKGNYHFYSEKRLKIFMLSFVEQTRGKTFDTYFFHGFTPWIETKPDKPYFCINDACFATYLKYYNDKNKFTETDVERIYSKEAKWLLKAQKAFFQSNWALEEAAKTYKLSRAGFENVGVGGFIDIPKEDKYDGGYNFLFISREFLPKGGLVAVAALELVRKKYPEAVLWIIGEKPDDKIVRKEGIFYKGFFDKNEEKDKKKLMKIFSRAFALIHPTQKDINPLVINELAYFGCPAISSAMFAIPEYVLDGTTGLLLNDPKDAVELSIKMLSMIKNPVQYQRLRKRARQRAITTNTWRKVGLRISTSIRKSL